MGFLLPMAVVGGIVFAALLSLYYKHTESGWRAMANYNSREYQESFRPADAETREWEDCDATPYGAIHGLFTDTDGDGDWG
jgi:hypothetical protein